MFLEVVCCAHACTCLLGPDYRSSRRRQTWGGACMFEDLENARESLCQDSPLWREGGPICISGGTSVCLWFPFLPGVHGDLPGHPAQILQVRVQVHCSLNKVKERKAPILWGQLPQLYRVSPVPSWALTLLLCGCFLVTHLSLGPLKDTVGSSLD